MLCCILLGVEVGPREKWKVSMNSAGNKILSKFPHLSAITVSHHSTPIITELILNFGEKRMWSLLTKKDVVTFDQKGYGHF